MKKNYKWRWEKAKSKLTNFVYKTPSDWPEHQQKVFPSEEAAVLFWQNWINQRDTERKKVFQKWGEPDHVYYSQWKYGSCIWEKCYLIALEGNKCTVLFQEDGERRELDEWEVVPISSEDYKKTLDEQRFNQLEAIPSINNKLSKNISNNLCEMPSLSSSSSSSASGIKRKRRSSRLSGGGSTLEKSDVQPEEWPMMEGVFKWRWACGNGLDTWVYKTPEYFPANDQETFKYCQDAYAYYKTKLYHRGLLKPWLKEQQKKKQQKKKNAARSGANANSPGSSSSISNSIGHQNES
jgi:hypothetical protein